MTVGIRLKPADFIRLHEIATAKGESVGSLLRGALERFTRSARDRATDSVAPEECASIPVSRNPEDD